MTCQFLKDGRCTLAESVAAKSGHTVECRPTERRCRRCLKESPTDQRPSAACLGLVTPHVPREQLGEWTAVVAGILAKPVQPPKSRGLGDTITKGLKAIGITEERATKVAKAFGATGCGCSKRRERLNKLVPY